jgi:hypothetical protein
MHLNWKLLPWDGRPIKQTKMNNVVEDEGDDLDAFFDEVEKTVELTTAAENDDDTEKDPPRKKFKPSSTSGMHQMCPLRPHGVVVAAAAPVIKTTTTTTTSTVQQTTRTKPTTSTTAATKFSSAHTTKSASASEDVVGPSVPQPSPPLPQPRTATATRASMPTNGANPTASGTGKPFFDETLYEWPDNDFRMFVGNIDPAVSDEALRNHFANRYTSFQKARIIREPKTGISKGYGFVSFANALELARALREMDQTWLGSRPIRVKRVPRQQQPSSSSSKSNAFSTKPILPIASSLKKKHKKK